MTSSYRVFMSCGCVKTYMRFNGSQKFQLRVWTCCYSPVCR